MRGPAYLLNYVATSWYVYQDIARYDFMTFVMLAVEQFDMRSLRQMFSAAAPLSKSLLETLDSRLRKLGADVHIFQGRVLTGPVRTCTY